MNNNDSVGGLFTYSFEAGVLFVDAITATATIIVGTCFATAEFFIFALSTHFFRNFCSVFPRTIFTTDFEFYDFDAN